MLRAHSRADGTDLTGGALEPGVGAPADTTVTGPLAIADLSIPGHTGGPLQGTVTGTPGVVGITDAHSALTATMS